MIHIAIIDDDEEIGKSLTRWLKTKDDLLVEGHFFSVKEIIKKKNSITACNILLLDIDLGAENGISEIQRLKNMFPETKIIMLTSYASDQHVISSLRAGASGYYLKGSGLDSLWDAIQQTSKHGGYIDPSVTPTVTAFFSTMGDQNGESGLTKREVQVIMGFVDGLSYKLIASRLGVTVHTINHFVRVIYKKLEVNSKAELIRMAYRGEIEGIVL